MAGATCWTSQPDERWQPMFKVMVRLVADTVLVAILLFLAAGTLAWWRAWVLLAVLILIRALGALAVYRVDQHRRRLA